MQGAALYRFGPFALDVEQRVLLRDDEPLRLTPRDVGVLIALVERHGELVDKTRLMDQVWQGVCVEECNLSQHVATLRRVLGDDARRPAYIETVSRRGYRFVAPVVQGQARKPLAAPSAEAALPEPPLPRDVAGHGDGEAPDADPVARELPPVPPLTPPSPDRPAWRARPLSLALAVLALPMAGLGCWGLMRAQAHPPAIRSIAVMPFANLTGDSHQEHLAETLTGALTDDLRRATGLRVEVARPPPGSHRIAGVDAYVETALLGAEGRLRIAAELIDAATERLLWAEMVESDPVAFVEAGERIVRGIVSRLERPRALAGEEQAGDPSAARREYALAVRYLSQRTPQVVEESIEHFQASLALDPSTALAHAGLADAYLFGLEQRVLPPDTALARAEAAARRALELDPGLAAAHAALGQVASARWDFETAEASYRRALTLDPAIAEVHERYAVLLTIQDRHDEAISEARVARDLNPNCPAKSTTLAAAFHHAGRYGAAIDQALAALRLTPRFAAAYDVLGRAHQANGHSAEAIAAFGEAVRLSDRSPGYVASLARAQALAGDRKEARKLLAEVERSAPRRAASPLDLAEILEALGETEAALRQVERAVAEEAPWLQRIGGGGGVVALHDHARFRELRSRMLLPASSPAAASGPRTATPGAAATCARAGACLAGPAG